MQTETNVTDLIHEWGSLSLSERLRAFNQLPRGQTDNVFLSLGTDEQLELIEHLPQNEQRIWLRLLPPDEAADLIQRAPEDNDSNFSANWMNRRARKSAR